MSREQAINYLYASGMSSEQVQAVVEALSVKMLVCPVCGTCIPVEDEEHKIDIDDGR
jgi:hypothetical protein